MLNKQKNPQMIKMILILYVQLKLPIGCYKKFNRKISHGVILAN